MMAFLFTPPCMRKVVVGLASMSWKGQTCVYESHENLNRTCRKCMSRTLQCCRGLMVDNYFWCTESNGFCDVVQATNQCWEQLVEEAFMLVHVLRTTSVFRSSQFTSPERILTATKNCTANNSKQDTKPSHSKECTLEQHPKIIPKSSVFQKHLPAHNNTIQHLRERQHGFWMARGRRKDTGKGHW